MRKYGPWYWIRPWLLCQDRSAAARRCACFLYFSTVIQYSIFAHGPQYYLFFFFFFFFIFRDVDLDGARHFRGKLSAIKLLSSELWRTLCGTYSDTSSWWKVAKEYFIYWNLTYKKKKPSLNISLHNGYHSIRKFNLEIYDDFLRTQKFNGWENKNYNESSEKIYFSVS